jgi:hypothetical protein
MIVFYSSLMIHLYRFLANALLLVSCSVSNECGLVFLLRSCGSNTPPLAAHHLHFLVQSVPTYSPTMIAAKIKSITAREIFAKVPSVKKYLRGGEFWTDGYFVSTVSEHANEDVIRHYVRNQGRAGEYKLLHKQKVVHHEQQTLF